MRGELRSVLPNDLISSQTQMDDNGAVIVGDDGPGFTIRLPRQQRTLLQSLDAVDYEKHGTQLVDIAKDCRSHQHISVHRRTNRLL